MANLETSAASMTVVAARTAADTAASSLPDDLNSWNHLKINTFNIPEVHKGMKSLAARQNKNMPPKQQF